MESNNKDKLTVDQEAALQRFADRCGRPWKSVLSGMWANGKDSGCTDGALLRQVRNQFGPEWLYSKDNPVKPGAKA